MARSSTKAGSQPLKLCVTCVLLRAEAAQLLQLSVFLVAVSRFRCRGDLYEMDLLLDVNTSVYNLQVLIDC